MPLAINLSQTQSGTAGAGGVAGANGTNASRPGGNGTAGGPGLGKLVNVTGQTWIGDAGGDQIRYDYTANGGRGGSGGNGGSGAAAQPTVVNSSGPGFQLTSVTYDTPGDGGAAGFGGAGGRGNVVFSNLDADLAGGAASQNSLWLTARANGGSGGGGSFSGAGGASSYTADWQTITISPAFNSTYSQQGTAGGFAPDGSAGGRGGNALAAFRTIDVTGENMLVNLFGFAVAGAGGNAGTGSRGGSGSAGAAGGDGGRGGDGGTALAEVTGLTVAATSLATTLGLNLTIQLAATGGAGGQGAQGGASGLGTLSDIDSINGVSSALETRTYAGAGNGGNGGNGGAATARVADSSILGSDVADQVALRLTATGGLGGAGGTGAAGVASETLGAGTSSVTVIVGIPPGTPGAQGTTGRALIEVLNTTISLGGGNDTLTLDLQTTTPGGRVTFSGNLLAGGLGQDRLVLGDGSVGEPAATLDLALGTLRLGAAPAIANQVTGFEIFVGTRGADRFIDGVGDQDYTGGLGADRFTFSAARPGQDVIRGMAAEDRLILKGYGPTLDSFAEVQNATQDTAQGARIDLGGGSSLLLAGFAKASLTADMLLF